MRKSGILLHITSLPSPGGIGTLGREAYAFADFLADAGQRLWQVLPTGPTGFGDSPYQPLSAFAGNPCLLDLGLLAEAGLLPATAPGTADLQSDAVSYSELYAQRRSLLRAACARFFAAPPSDFRDFCQKEAAWLDDYALFMALKEAHDGAAWQSWEASLRFREPAALRHAAQALQPELQFWRFVQYAFFRQWSALKAYANHRGIELIGDLPIYAAMDSADVWAAPEGFLLDEERRPAALAGCPPDAFSEDGQLWGNPLFDWEAMRGDGYRWWKRRLSQASRLFDLVRIDHFRGFESYWAVPAGAQTARDGAWQPGPGLAFFQETETARGPLRVIAEDLGFLTDAVRGLLRDCGFPGMKVLQFAFEGGAKNPYLPHNYEKSCVVYTGTHDNDTTAGWLAGLSKETRARLEQYLGLSARAQPWDLIRAAWASTADTAIVPMQDLLGLDGSARMNTPSTIGRNWHWRMAAGAASPELAAHLREITALYGRL